MFNKEEESDQHLYCLHQDTCLCNVYPLTPHFYIVKLGFTGVYIIFLLYPLQTVFAGWYTVFTLSVRPSVRPSVRMLHFVSLISLRVIDGISSNLAYLFISTGPILIIKMYGLGANSMRVISLCNS